MTTPGTTTDPGGQPRLAVAGLTVRYGDLVAVDDVSLAVDPGQVLSLLGPSGCGKSSLLHAVAGLVPATGAIRVDGRDVGGLRPDRRGLGLMFQQGALFPHLDVAGNVGFGPRMQGWPAGRRSDRVDEVLALVGLAGMGARSVDELSGGQAQRVALARAIAPNPPLLLLDEPLSSLDKRLRDRLIDELPDVFAAVDAAVVHVTHDQDEAMALADRVAIMQAGRIVRRGPPTEVWAEPRSAFVARFLGWRNVFEPGSPGARLGPDGLDPPPGGAIGVDAGRVAVRSDAEPVDDAPRDGQAWSGRVLRRRFAGDHAAVDVEVASGVVLRATGPVHAMPAQGEAVQVTIPDGAWRELDADPAPGSPG